MRLLLASGFFLLLLANLVFAIPLKGDSVNIFSPVLDSFQMVPFLVVIFAFLFVLGKRLFKKSFSGFDAFFVNKSFLSQGTAIRKSIVVLISLCLYVLLINIAAYFSSLGESSLSIFFILLSSLLLFWLLCGFYTIFRK